jgi:putative alpha-1,2-mannosidase
MRIRRPLLIAAGDLTFRFRTASRVARILRATILFAAAGAVLHAQTPPPSTDYVHRVYPFLGVDWGGNTFVGAALPFGMVKLGPDMESFDGATGASSASATRI